MDSLSGILAFVRTAQALSFVAAGRTLGISASAVGKNVAKLEQSVGVRLFHRSTRRVSLTQEGALFYERCQRILAELQDAEELLSQVRKVPRGRLRISLPTIGYRFLLPMLPEFIERHPEIELDLDFSDRIVDVIEEGFDAVIRSGQLPDSSLKSKRLGQFHFVLCAAPGYLKRAGTPRNPNELEQHRCLRFRFPSSGKLQEWRFRDAATGSVVPTGMTCNNMEALLEAAVRGVGIAYMPDFLAREALANGALRSIIHRHLLNPGQFWLLWPSSRQLSPRLRVFLDYVSAHPQWQKEALRYRDRDIRCGRFEQ